MSAVWPVSCCRWAILAAMGLVIPNALAVALSRHPDAAGTAAALLGSAQFGLGAAVAPLVGVLGNDEFALAVVMTSGGVIALFAAFGWLRPPGPPTTSLGTWSPNRLDAGRGTPTCRVTGGYVASAESFPT